MNVGVATFVTDRSWDVRDLAVAVERRGLASLVVREHTHMPVDHDKPPAGSPLPDEYRRTWDPLIALTVAATSTTTLELVTGVLLLAQRDPIVTAKAVATLDHVAAGRLTLGVGYGWNRPEVESHGIRWDERRDVLRDNLEAMIALWSQEVAEVATEHVQISPSWSWPKPAQRPHPRILLGASLGPRTTEHLVDVCEGWLARGAAPTLEGRDELTRAWTAAGRKGAPHIYTQLRDPLPAQLPGLATAGVEQVVVNIPSGPREKLLGSLDAAARLQESLPSLRPDML